MPFFRKKAPEPQAQTQAAILSPQPKLPEKTLYAWKIAGRPYKKRSREYYTTIASIVFLVAVILLFLKEWLLIAVIISLTFVAYVLASVKPEDVDHKITNWGIVTGGKKYKWEGLTRYWFSNKFFNTLLHVDTKLSFPRQLIILVDGQKDKIDKILQAYLTHEKPEKTFIDKSAEWLQKKVPLETETPSIN